MGPIKLLAKGQPDRMLEGKLRWTSILSRGIVILLAASRCRNCRLRKRFALITYFNSCELYNWFYFSAWSFVMMLVKPKQIKFFPMILQMQQSTKRRATGVKRGKTDNFRVCIWLAENEKDCCCDWLVRVSHLFFFFFFKKNELSKSKDEVIYK